MDTYQIITDKIIKQLEAGKVAWRKDWKSSNIPQNLVSKRAYSGINFFLLSLTEYEHPYWLTYNQAQLLGGSVKKGEHGTQVIFWKLLDFEDKEAEESDKKSIKIPMLRYYTIFNIAQCEGVKLPKIKKLKFAPVKRAEQIVTKYPNPPRIEHNGDNRAYYNTVEDSIHLPKKTDFASIEGYYSTLFHELTHSTGHNKRLKRWGENYKHIFASEDYSSEELVAELGGAFLCADSGISNKVIKNESAYIAAWLENLRNDKKLIIYASAKATKAARYIKGEPISQE